MKNTKVFSRLSLNSFLLFSFALTLLGAGFAIPQVSLAACTYGVNFDTNPKTVYSDGKVTFTTKVTVAGTLNSKPCHENINKVGIRYQVSSNSTGLAFHGVSFLSNLIELTFDSKGEATHTQDYYLNNFYTASGAAKNTGIPVLFPEHPLFRVRVYDYELVPASSFGPARLVEGGNVTTSANVPVTINGPAGSLPRVSYSPVKSTYTAGETLTIAFTNMPTGGFSASISINSGIPTPCSSVTCNLKIEKPTFKDGNNSIMVTAVDKDGKTITLQNSAFSISLGTGSGTPGGPGPGTGTTSTTTLPTDRLYNPLPEENLTTMFLLIVRGFIAILGIWAVMFIIIGGFRMITAAGNEETYGQAKKTVTWAVLGLIVAMLSFSIVAIVQNLLQATVK